MNFDFGAVISKAWKITWKYKVLWIFGLLASCGQGGSNSSNFQSSADSTGSNLPPEMMYELNNAAEQLLGWLAANMWVIYAFFALMLVLIAAQIFVNIVGSAGLTRGVYHADGGAETLQFGTLFRESLGYFWRLFGLGLVIWLPFFILFFGALFAVIFLVIQDTSPSTVGTSMLLFIIGFCCCMFPIIFVLTLFDMQARRALLIENLGIFAAIERGWKVFIGNLGVLFIMWLLMFIIGLVAGAVLAAPIFIVVFPLMFDFMAGEIQSWQPFITAGIILLFYSPIHWFLRSVLLVFSDSTWTLTYLRITVTPSALPPVAEQGPEEPVIVPPSSEANA